MGDFSTRGCSVPTQPVEDTVDPGCFQTMPQIKVSDEEMTGNNCAFIKTRNYYGTEYEGTPPEGTIQVPTHFNKNKRIENLRTIAHELVHSAFDKLKPEQQDSVVRLFLGENSIQSAKQFLYESSEHDVYLTKYRNNLESYGEREANRFLVDEVIAPFVSFMLYMPEQIALYNKWDEESIDALLSDPSSGCGSVEDIRALDEKEGRPWREPETPDEWKELVHSTNVTKDDAKWYMLKGNDIDITPQLEASLRQYCLIPTREIVEDYYQNISTELANSQFQ